MKKIEDCTIEECCKFLKANTKLLAKHLGKQEHLFVTMYNRLADRILEAQKEDRKRIAENVENKMCYMSCCPNERDIYLHIIAPDDYPLLKKSHCDIDCPFTDCVSNKLKGEE